MRGFFMRLGLFCGLVAVPGSTGCVTTPPNASSAVRLPPAPEWVERQTGVHGNELRGVGSASGVRNQKLRRSVAISRARVEADRLLARIVERMTKWQADRFTELSASEERAIQGAELARKKFLEDVRPVAESESTDRPCDESSGVPRCQWRVETWWDPSDKTEYGLAVLTSTSVEAYIDSGETFRSICDEYGCDAPRIRAAYGREFDALFSGK